MADEMSNRYPAGNNAPQQDSSSAGSDFQSGDGTGGVASGVHTAGGGHQHGGHQHGGGQHQPNNQAAATGDQGYNGPSRDFSGTTDNAPAQPSNAAPSYDYTPAGSAAGGYRDPNGGTGMIDSAAGGGHIAFNINDPQERQRILQQLQNYGDGNTQRLAPADLGNMAHGWVNQAQPQHIADATTHAVQQLPPQQQTDFIHHVTGWLQQHGVDPQQAGVHSPAGQPLSPQDIGKVIGHTQQQNPDLIKQLFSPGGALQSPAVQVGLAGALAFAASKFLK